ncbi:hypothetical protein ACRALDRAFT_1063323 [Sodiomyces alcalophilus JCM 7366]|uniref:uncharacterized protein n=1 Tax=Sodiomyces alcalophilus JCM 7366 TaxID=591952 RepID=UPI0039B44C31
MYNFHISTGIRLIGGGTGDLTLSARGRVRVSCITRPSSLIPVPRPSSLETLEEPTPVKSFVTQVPDMIFHRLLVSSHNPETREKAYMHSSNVTEM